MSKCASSQQLFFYYLILRNIKQENLMDNFNFQFCPREILQQTW